MHCRDCRCTMTQTLNSALSRLQTVQSESLCAFHRVQLNCTGSLCCGLSYTYMEQTHVVLSPDCLLGLLFTNPIVCTIWTVKSPHWLDQSNQLVLPRAFSFGLQLHHTCQRRRDIHKVRPKNNNMRMALGKKANRLMH